MIKKKSKTQRINDARRDLIRKLSELGVVLRPGNIAPTNIEIYKAIHKAYGISLPDSPTKKSISQHLIRIANNDGPLNFQVSNTAHPKKVKVATRLKKVKVVDDVDANSDDFLSSYQWRRLRYGVLVKREARCECCGRTSKDGIQIHVDHIKPRRKYPELALEESNLQVLCEDCNHGKGNWDETDWRKIEPLPSTPRFVRRN